MFDSARALINSLVCLILYERSGPRSVSDFSTAELSASVQKKERKIYVKLTRRKLEHKLFLFGREKKEEKKKTHCAPVEQKCPRQF